jgi:hypothetical protein
MSNNRCIRPSRTTVLAVMLAGSISSRTEAQSPQPDSALRSIITRVAADNRQRIRVTSPETQRLEGNRVSLLDDSVFVSTESGTRAIPLARVDSVWIYRGTAAPILGLIAALPCAVFGAAAGGFIGGDPDSQGSSGKAALFSIIGLLAGGAVCGSVGAGFGSLIDRWRLEYVRVDLGGFLPMRAPNRFISRSLAAEPRH